LQAFGTSDGSLRIPNAPDAEMQRFIGWCNQEAAKRPHKIEYLDRLLESAAAFWPKAWLELGKFRVRYGIEAGVAYALQRAVEEVPNSTAAWIERWRYAAQQGDGGTYVASLVGAAESAPDDPFLLSAIAGELTAYISVHENDIEPARRAIFLSSVRKRMEAVADVLTADGFARLGWLCMYENDLDDAERYARRGLRLVRNNAECRRLLVKTGEARRGMVVVDRDSSRVGFREDLETRARIRAEILTRLQSIVTRSAVPVLMSKAGHELVSEFGPRLVESNWLGSGSFRQFLRTFPNLGFAVDPRHPGFIYDPTRHELPAETVGRAFTGEIPPEQEAMMRGGILARLQRLVAESPRPVVMAHAASELIRQFGPIVHESNWFRSGSFVQFLRTYPNLGFEVDTRIPGFLYDSERADFSSDLGLPELALQVPSGREQELRTQIRERLERMVADSPTPILMAQASDELIREFGLILRESKWFGCGSFRVFLGTFQELNFAVAQMNGPDLLYDPTRHDVSSRPIYVLRGVGTEMASFIDELHRTIKTPRISPTHFRMTLDVTAQLVNDNGFNFIETGKTVRDLCAERGESITRGSIQWILRGLMFERALPPTEWIDFEMLANATKANINRLARSAGRLLTDDDMRLLDKWVRGVDTLEGRNSTQ
ncbi:MAG: hypothetical protein M3M96_02720, partial [Candidatus Eremiobacteraeota bacterium]|nr:hypothetical protein [Candidatus Eremiobacteraeota bacterium]